MAAAATEDIDSMYNCNICNRIFQLQYMYACYHGHYLCRKCYKRVYYKGKEKKCPHGSCNAMMMRNREVEDSGGEPIERSKLMFPNPSVYMKHSNYVNKSLLSLATIYKPSIFNLGSKKPIQCPHHDCNKTIAVSSLDSHFEHDHKRVASIITELEVRNGLEFNFRDLYSNVRALCLVLINLDDKSDGPLDLEILPATPEEHEMRAESFRSYSSKMSQPMTIPKPFFIVMAAKVTANDYTEDDEEEEPDYGFSPIDRIIFYVTSNIATNYSYTIAVSTSDQSIRVKYYGPLLTMNENYKKLCAEGKGLILNNKQVDGMGSCGNRNVSLDVIIHERGMDSYDSD